MGTEDGVEHAGSTVFGQFLDSVRRTAKLNRTQFAERLGISRQHLWVIENGRQGVTPQRAARFAKRLGGKESLFVEAALQAMVENAGLDYEVKVQQSATGHQVA
ncbi:MAG: helix-turn-helix transcriptional regulator [Myxococcota bacterium]